MWLDSVQLDPVNVVSWFGESAKYHQGEPVAVIYSDVVWYSLKEFAVRHYQRQYCVAVYSSPMLLDLRLHALKLNYVVD